MLAVAGWERVETGVPNAIRCSPVMRCRIKPKAKAKRMKGVVPVSAATRRTRRPRARSSGLLMRRPRVPPLAPVGELGLPFAWCEPFQSVDIVVVLEPLLVVRGASPIAFCQLAPEQVERSLIGQNVVQHENEKTVACEGLLDQQHPKERSCGERKRLASLANRGRGGLAGRYREAFDRDLRDWVHDLPDFVSVLAKRRAKQAVPRGESVQTELQCRHAQRLWSAKGADEMVRGRGRLQLLQEPDAPLPFSEPRGFVGWASGGLERTRSRRDSSLLNGLP